MVSTQNTLNGIVMSKTPEDVCTKIFYEPNNIHSYLHHNQYTGHLILIDSQTYYIYFYS